MTETGNMVQLNADESELFNRQVKDLLGAVSTLREMATNGSLSSELRNTLGSLLGSYVVDLCATVGYHGELEAEKEQRFARIRALNQKVRDLEAQLGGQVDDSALAERLKLMHSELNRWWDLRGFGHISSITFSSYGVASVEFSCSLFGSKPILHSPTPASDREFHKDWLKSLQADGFILARDPDSCSNRDLVDCEQNRELIIGRVLERFPSARFVNSRNYHSKYGFMLCSITFDIEQISDILVQAS